MGGEGGGVVSLVNLTVFLVWCQSKLVLSKKSVTQINSRRLILASMNKKRLVVIFCKKTSHSSRSGSGMIKVWWESEWFGGSD